MTIVGKHTFWVHQSVRGRGQEWGGLREELESGAVDVVGAKTVEIEV